MRIRTGGKGINRRDFLKAGVAGTASVVLGRELLADSVCQANPAAFVFPRPVYRTLGRTGLKITIVSFGAMLTPEPEVIRVAFEHGINYVDTARVYMGGRNEEIVGRALKGLRDKVYVATKTRPSSQSQAAIFRDVENSLRALGTDHIDVIQLHNLTDRDRIYDSETREALLKLRKQGKVRFFGVTTHSNQADVLHGLADDKDKLFDTALVGYNFQSGADVRDAVARAAKAGIGIVAMKTQAGGYATESLGPVSPHQAALKWALQNPHITTAIPGMRDMSHLMEDVAVMGLRFGLLDRFILKSYAAAIKPYYCHLCGLCEKKCPRRVSISVINRSLMYADGYRSPDLARSTYREIPPERSAAACIDCTECTAKCVNGLDIAAKMARARQVFA
jgi:aryl-alcohol dehydrogenase-like predicted oxidoreductase